jgi:hypothetical protein
VKSLLATLAVLAAQAQPSPKELLDQALAQARQGRYSEAAQLLRSGRTAWPQDHRFPQELAGIHYRQRQYTEAKAELHDALRLDPGDSYTNEFLAILYELEENLPAALKYWNRINKPVLDSVRFSPTPELDPVLLARIPAASPGQLLTPRRLQRTEVNVAELDVFSDYRLQLTGQELTIHTVSRSGPAGRWYWRLLPYLRGVVYQQVNADFYNLGRKASNFQTLWRWDADKRRIAAALSGPFGLSRYRMSVDIRDERWSLVRAALPGLNLRKFAAGAEASFNAGERVQWTTGIWTSSRRLRSADPDLAREGWLAELRNRLEAPLFHNPERRLQMNGWASLRSGRWIGHNVGSGRFLAVQAGSTTRWYPQAKGEKYEIQAQMRAGAMSPGAPLDEQYILGMERDNDLWLRGHIGTRGGRKGNAPQGSQYLLMNIDARRELLRLPFLRFQVGLFGDFGAVRDPKWYLGSRGLLYDSGLEATLATVGGVKFLAVYGRDLRDGRPAFYTAVTR